MIELGDGIRICIACRRAAGETVQLTVRPEKIKIGRRRRRRRAARVSSGVVVERVYLGSMTQADRRDRDRRTADRPPAQRRLRTRASEAGDSIQLGWPPAQPRRRFRRDAGHEPTLPLARSRSRWWPLALLGCGADAIRGAGAGPGRSRRAGHRRAAASSPTRTRSPTSCSTPSARRTPTSSCRPPASAPTSRPRRRWPAASRPTSSRSASTR